MSQICNISIASSTHCLSPNCIAPTVTHSPPQIYIPISQMYKRRSDINPLWNQILVAGLDGDEKPFLASVDLLGTTFSSPTLATGFGAHLAQPLLRQVAPGEEDVPSVTREKAVEAIKECMKVLFYRDARSMDKYSIAVVTKAGGVELKEDEQLEGQSWAFAETIRGYGTQVA